MKYTNKLGLPQALVDAVINDGYTRGNAHISITGLISPPRIRVLEKQHQDELVEDISERIFVLLGQLMHGVLERANTTAMAEKRYYLDIDGIRISGQLDAYYDNGLVQDYKLVSLYSVKDGVKLEYEQQLNCYAALLRANGVLVSKLELVCILRDWSKGKALGDKFIPQQQVIKLDVPMWSNGVAVAFLKERIKLHKDANINLPECTPEEMWQTPTKWAVMPKKNAARSLRNYNSKEEAEQHSTMVKGSFVEIRPGVNNRCDSYCSVSQFCSQYQNLKKKKDR